MGQNTIWLKLTQLGNKIMLHEVKLSSKTDVLM